VGRPQTNDELLVPAADEFERPPMPVPRFSWTGSTSVAGSAISATPSHYGWATKLIRRAVTTVDAHLAVDAHSAEELTR